MNSKRFRTGLFLLVLVATLLLVPSMAAAADYVVTPGDGVTFAQVDQTFAGFGQADSQWCRVNVDIATLAAASGINRGFLNVWQVGYGWAPENLLVDASAGPTSVGTYFGLPVAPGTDVTSMSAYVVFSSDVQTSFAAGAPSTFAVGAEGYNAEGRGPSGTTTGLGVTPAAGSVSFAELFWRIYWALFPTNVETAPSQCGPAAAANSLQMLELRYPGVEVPHDNVAGVSGAPENSLVGQLDLHMNRAAGAGVEDEDMIRGKLSYIEANGLTDNLYVKYSGHHVPAAITTAGVGAARKDTSPTISWLVQELKAGEDVEIGWHRPGGGGHWAKLEGIAMDGKKAILTYSHDASQGVPGGLRFDQITVEDTNTDGMLEVLQGDTVGSQIDVAVSESPKHKTPAVSLGGLTAIAALALGIAIGLKQFAPRRGRTASGAGT